MARSPDPSLPPPAYQSQWTNPKDVFSVLLLLGGDVVNRALAQLAGTCLTPVAFSFGWVAYAVSALVSSVGENKLMPAPDCNGLVINGEFGNVRDNSSWILGRIIRDFHYWSPPATRSTLKRIIDERHQDLLRKNPNAKRPKQTGLCITIFEASDKQEAGKQPMLTLLSLSGIFVTIVQLSIAAIPCAIFGDWGILTITAAGVALSYVFGALPQWRREKWACRRNSRKTVVLTRGNGAQHAIVILGTGLSINDEGRGLDLEDLAAVAANIDVLASFVTRVLAAVFAFLWVLLLITAAGTQANTWFLIAVGGLGIIQNATVAGWPRRPKHLGVPLKFVETIGHKKVMQALFLLEERYPRTGRSVRDIFFQGRMNTREREHWDILELEADWYEAARKTELVAIEATEKNMDITNNKESSNATKAAPGKSVLINNDTDIAEATKITEDAEIAVERAREAFESKYQMTRTLKWAWKDTASTEDIIYT